MKLIVLLGLFAVFLKLKAEGDFIKVLDEPNSDGEDKNLHQDIGVSDEAESGEVNESLFEAFSASDETEYGDVNENLPEAIGASDEAEADEVNESIKLDDKVPNINLKADVAAEEATPKEGSSENDFPVFSKHLYIANYILSNTLEMEETIIASGAKENMVVRQSGYDEYFKISQNLEKQEELEVKTLKPLAQEMLKNNYIVIEIEAQNEESSHVGLTILLINLPSETNTDHPSIFSKGVYYANYISTNELEMKETITIKYGAKENMAVLQSGYDEYFKISQNPSKQEELDVKIVKPLTQEILKENYIIIDIEAKNEESSYSGLTTLLINLPSQTNTDHPPIFSKGVYYANYISNKELEMKETITIKYGVKENMAVRQSGYDEYFKVSQNPSKQEELDVKIVKPLTQEILKENYIIIDIETQNEGSAYLGLTTLLIDLQSEKDDGNGLHPPVFSKSVYFANYAANHTLKMEETIIIKYGATDNTIVKQSSYEEYIKISLNVLTKTELQVEIIKPLDDKTLENDLIVIEIIAENEGLSIPTRSNLIIRLEKELPNCYVVHILGYAVGYTVFPLILFICSITLIAFVNAIVISLYCKKYRVNSYTA